MSHAFVTVVIPFDPDTVAAVEAALDSMGNPVKDDVRAAVDAIGTIHFMSITVVPGDATDPAYLILERPPTAARTRPSAPSPMR